MRGIILARRALLIVTVALLAVVSHNNDAGASDPMQGIGSLADHGEQALGKLPWKSTIVRANLSKRIPTSISAMYLMEKQLLVVTSSGMVHCLDRRNLEPRWAHALRYPLAKPPAEGATHYAFLLKDHMGAHWVHAISKRSGSAGARWPVRLPYAASSGIGVNSALVFVGSLGSPKNNTTLETVNLVSGRRSWGYRSTGLIWGAPALVPGGEIVVIAGDDGVVTALSGGASAPSSENWIRDLGGGAWGTPAVTPEHVVIGNDDGILYNLNLFSGAVNWLKGLDERIRADPVVIGGYETITKAAGVEGAAPIEVRKYTGMVFARNVKGLHAFDLNSGKALFKDGAGGRPLLRNGKHLLTVKNRMITIRDISKNYAVSGRLNLRMFHLMPCNKANGELYACTADGMVVAAIPK